MKNCIYKAKYDLCYRHRGKSHDGSEDILSTVRRDNTERFEMSEHVAEKTLFVQAKKLLDAGLTPGHFVKIISVSKEILVRVGDFVEANTKHRRYKVAHAPNGGRTVELGPKYKKPFAMLIPSTHIMDGCPVKSGVKIDIGQEFEIENYGLHIILAQRPFDGDSVRIFRKEDGFIS